MRRSKKKQEKGLKKNIYQLMRNLKHSPNFLKKKKEKKRNAHFQLKGIFDGIRIFDWQTSPKHPN